MRVGLCFRLVASRRLHQEDRLAVLFK